MGGVAFFLFQGEEATMRNQEHCSDLKVKKVGAAVTKECLGP